MGFYHCPDDLLLYNSGVMDIGFMTSEVHHRVVRSQAGSTLVVVCQVPCELLGLEGFNYSDTTVAYLRLFDLATVPTIWDRPVQLFPLMGRGSSVSVGGVAPSIGDKSVFTKGLALSLTGSSTDGDDSVALSANQVVVNIRYRPLVVR